MTADVEMLPCPWCGEKLASVSVSEGGTSRWRKVDGCCADGPEVRHNTMAEDQEAAEVESRAAAIAAWNTRANVAHATAAKDAEVEALRAEVELLRRGIVPRDDDMIVPVKLLDEINASGAEWKARAERLAEALREAEKSLRTIADLAGGTEYLMTIGDVRGYANSRAYAARAALRDHDQENRND